MRLGVLLAAVGAATLALPAADAAPARRAAPAARDWARTVVATPEGGFRMGNPSARVKLVEYGSLTCGHCAAFARDGMAGLVGRYVRSGKVSYEYRNYILNGLDIAASLVARCGGPARFFPVADKLYATQRQWMGRVSALTPAQKAQLNALPEAQRLPRLAEVVGLLQLGAQHGIAPGQAKGCLADQAGLDRLGKMAQAAETLGVGGTPTFLLNGANIGTHTWGTLEPILREQAGS
jgi:protein-disulfide isomerase